MSRDAARLFDATSHNTPLTGLGCPNVLIGDLPAWRVGDWHTCPLANLAPPTLHIGGVVLLGCLTVLIGGQSATGKGHEVIEPKATEPRPASRNMIATGHANTQLGEPGFGIMSAGALEEFCKAWDKLRADWANPNMTATDRQAAMKRMVDNALGHAGAPPLDYLGYPTRVMTMGSAVKYAYFPQFHSVLVSAGIFDSATPPAGSAGAKLFHEARHAEQNANSASVLAGAGWSSEQIAQHGISPSLAIYGRGHPLATDTVGGVQGLMNDWAARGSGPYGHEWSQGVYQSMNDAYSRGAGAYQKAADAYLGLPSEGDATNAEEELKRKCAGANDH